MLRVYVYKNFISHALNQIIGFLVLAIFFYLAIAYPKTLGIKTEYDIINSASDLFSFIILLLFLGLVLIQFLKGYLLYIPSTYISFNSEGISFKRFKKNYRFIKWQEIEVINLKMESEWLLNMLIKNTNGEITRIQLSELWFLSLFKKWCVSYNFLKLVVIANENPMLMKNLIREEVEFLYSSFGVKIK